MPKHDPPAPRTLAEIEAALRTMSGYLDDDNRYEPSFWNTLARSGAQPKSIQAPQDFTGGDAIAIACTQLDMPARQQQRLVDAWCEFIPTLQGVRRLWFTSRTSQAMFEAACRLPTLESLWVKWSGIRDLAPLAQLPRLQHLHLGQSGAVESLAPLAGLQGLRWLQVEGTTKAPTIEPLGALTQLEGLGFVGSDGKAITLPNLAPLSALTALTWLHLGALRVADGSLRPLAALQGLRWLGLPNWFAMPEYAWLAARLPGTRCDLLQPFMRFHASVFRCPACKTHGRVMTCGKGSKLLCPNCDTSRLARTVFDFEKARAAAGA